MFSDFGDFDGFGDAFGYDFGTSPSITTTTITNHTIITFGNNNNSSNMQTNSMQTHQHITDFGGGNLEDIEDNGDDDEWSVFKSTFG